MNNENHRIYGDYVITGIRNAFNSKTSYWLSKRDCAKAVYCFTATDQEVENQIRDGWDSYIRLLESSTGGIEWADYADEHVLLLRPLNPINPNAFECVKVTAGDGGGVRFLHDVIYLDDYLEEHRAAPERLDDILSGFGYKGLDGFVDQNAPGHTNFERMEKETLDRSNDPAYIIDLPLLASLICESREGEPMAADQASRLVQRITGLDLKDFIRSFAREDRSEENDPTSPANTVQAATHTACGDTGVSRNDEQGRA